MSSSRTYINIVVDGNVNLGTHKVVLLKELLEKIWLVQYIGMGGVA